MQVRQSAHVHESSRARHASRHPIPAVTRSQGGRKLADWDALGEDDEAGGGGGAEEAELQAAIQLSLAESPLKGSCSPCAARLGVACRCCRSMPQDLQTQTQKFLLASMHNLH